MARRSAAAVSKKDTPPILAEPARKRAPVRKSRPRPGKKPAPAAEPRHLLTPNEKQKVWFASMLLLLLIGFMAIMSGEIHHKGRGFKGGFRDLRGDVHWWVEVEPGEWPRITHRS